MWHVVGYDKEENVSSAEQATMGEIVDDLEIRKSHDSPRLVQTGIVVSVKDRLSLYHNECQKYQAKKEAENEFSSEGSNKPGTKQARY